MQASVVNPQKILFSPFVAATDVTDASVQEMPIVDMMSVLSQSPSFMASDRAFLVLGVHSSQGLSREELRDLTVAHGLKGKVRWIGDSSEFVRITHDGIVTDSKSALAPSSYDRTGVDVRTLESIQAFTTSQGS